MTDAQNHHLPKQISIEYFADHMLIKRKWFGGAIIMMSLFMVFGLGIQGFIFYLFRTEFSDATEMLIYFEIIFVLVDVFLFYMLAAGWVNHTDIIINKKTLEIKHAPLWWMGNKTLKAEIISQFYVQENITTQDNLTTISYELRYILHDAKSAKLISGLFEREHAEHIEQKIEQYLGIIDVPTPTF